MAWESEGALYQEPKPTPGEALRVWDLWRNGKCEFNDAAAELVRGALVRESERARETLVHESEPTTPKAMWGHAPDDHPESGWCGGCDTRDAAIAEGRTEYDGRGFFITSGEAADPAKYLPSLEWILECIADSAGDEVGDLAEDFPDVSEEAKAELDALLNRWAREHIHCAFWVPTGEAEAVSGQVVEP